MWILSVSHIHSRIDECLPSWSVIWLKHGLNLSRGPMCLRSFITPPKTPSTTTHAHSLCLRCLSARLPNQIGCRRGSWALCPFDQTAEPWWQTCGLLLYTAYQVYDINVRKFNSAPERALATVLPEDLHQGCLDLPKKHYLGASLHWLALTSFLSRILCLS